MQRFLGGAQGFGTHHCSSMSGALCTSPVLTQKPATGLANEEDEGYYSRLQQLSLEDETEKEYRS
jgi:hypothetical protein